MILYSFVSYIINFNLLIYLIDEILFPNTVLENKNTFIPPNL